jgi:Arc-like DNA binding dprotein
MARKLADIIQFKLRIRESLRRQIEKAARANKTSSNSEMAARLEKSFRDDSAGELVGIVAELKALNWDAMREINQRHDVIHAASVLALQVQQLPDIENRAGIKAALAQLDHALQALGKVLGTNNVSKSDSIAANKALVDQDIVNSDA